MFYSLYNTKPNLIHNILYERLWCNENILINNKPFYDKQWDDAGVKFMRDLFSGNQIVTKQQLEEKYSISCDFFFSNGIKAAIPHSWIEKIKQFYGLWSA